MLSPPVCGWLSQEVREESKTLVFVLPSWGGVGIFPARMRKLVRTCGLVLLFFLGVGAILLALGWWWLPNLLEEAFAEIAKEEKISEASLRVKSLGLQESEVADLRLVHEDWAVSLASARFAYEPEELGQGRLQTATLDDLRLEINLDALLARQEAELPAPETDSPTLERLTTDLLASPPLKSLQLRNARIATLLHGLRQESSLDADLTTADHSLDLSLRGALDHAPLSIDFSVHPGADTGHLRAVARIDDVSLPLLGKAVLPHLAHLGVSLPGEILSGQASVLAAARISGNEFVSPTLHARAHDLHFLQEGHTLHLPDLLLVGLQDEADLLTLRATGSAELNASAPSSASLLHLSGWSAHANLDANACRLSQVRIGSLRTHSPLPPLTLDGLVLPDWNVSLQAPDSLPKGQTKTLAFEQLVLNDDALPLSLYQGSLSVTFPSAGSLLPVRLAPTTLSLPTLGLTLERFAYDGLLDLEQLPALPQPQTLSAERLHLGEDALLHDLALTFRIPRLPPVENAPPTLRLDALALTYETIPFELRPAGLAITPGSDSSLLLDFNGSDLHFPDLDLHLQGLRGRIPLLSLDPIATAEPAELRFDSIHRGDLALSSGRLRLSMDRNGSFAIHDAQADFLGGRLRLLPSESLPFEGKLRFNLALENLDGSRIVALFDAFDGEMEGTFSGHVPLRFENAKWRASGGHLLMDAHRPGHLRYRADGLLTEGMEPKGAEYKLRRNTELALKDLVVEAIRLDLVEEDGLLKIHGQVRGKSQVDDKTTVNLNYRPRIQTDLWRLLQEIDFGLND